LNSRTNAKAGQAARKTYSWSFLPARVIHFAFRSVLLFAVAIHVVASGRAWSQPASDEYQLKAAFLFHFAQLVEWPADAFDGSGSPFALCTLEDDAFYDELENTLQGKQVGSRIIRIRHVHLSQAAHSCNMLFISKSESKSLQLAAVRNLPVLTVGEANDFLNSGGMIRFRFEQDKIRFDINREAADSSHLKISSRLLLLATSVTRGSGMDQER
jgi:hypothetical protein